MPFFSSASAISLQHDTARQQHHRAVMATHWRRQRTAGLLLRLLRPQPCGRDGTCQAGGRRARAGEPCALLLSVTHLYIILRVRCWKCRMACRNRSTWTKIQGPVLPRMAECTARVAQQLSSQAGNSVFAAKPPVTNQTPHLHAPPPDDQPAPSLPHLPAYCLQLGGSQGAGGSPHTP